MNTADRGATTHVLVLGGYGFFGRRLVERLARDAGIFITVAGRQRDAADKVVDSLRSSCVASLASAKVDATDVADLRKLLDSCPAHIVINTCGPFQQRDYRVASACIGAGSHYVDLADGRDFVAGIGTLDATARTHDVLVVSGASSVPALSAAAVDRLSEDLSEIHAIDIGISPGNRTERGLATVQSILGYCGKSITGWTGGVPAKTTGWSTAWTHDYPAPIGRRWLSPCDVPDLELFPQRYTGLRDVRFGAGLELRALHAGMILMSLLRRVGLVSDWSAHAGLLKRISDLFRAFGSDAGAMHVRVSGIAADGQACVRTWTLVAEHDDGPYVPTLAAAALVRGIASGRIAQRGAMPCIGLLTLADFEQEMGGLAIRTAVGETP